VFVLCGYKEGECRTSKYGFHGKAVTIEGEGAEGNRAEDMQLRRKIKPRRF